MLACLAVIFALGALLQTGAVAVPPAKAGCGDPDIALCMLGPMSVVTHNPLGMALIHKMSGPMANAFLDLSPDELNSFCQLQSKAGDCAGDYINHCTTSVDSIPNAANFFEFISGTVAFARALCARPTWRSDVKLVADCIKQSNVKFGNNSCTDKGPGALEDPFFCSEAGSVPERGLVGFRNYHQQKGFLGSICCSMDKVHQCAKQDFTGTCSPQADALIKESLQLLDTSYSCSERLAGCGTISQRIMTKKNGCRLPS